MTRRGLTCVAVIAACALIAAPALTGHAPRLIWNASASVPIGLYLTRPVAPLSLGDLVAVTPSGDLAAFLAGRGSLPHGVLLIKQVLALPGARICREGAAIIVEGQVRGEARERDRLGRDLPRWQGCRVLAEGEVFLMNADAPDSFDGRYFGPLPITSITARLTPVWTDETGTGRFEWWASMR